MYFDRVYVIGLCRDITPYLHYLKINIGIITSLFTSHTIIIFAGDKSSNALAQWSKEEKQLIIIPESSNGKDSNLVYGRNLLLELVFEMHKIKTNGTIDKAVVVIIDLDEVNEFQFDKAVLEKTLQQHDQWDAVTFNRKW